MAGLSIVSALTQQIILLPFAIIPLMAGIGIMRKRVWSAYGFALCLFAQLLLLALVVFRSSDLTTRLPEIIGAAVLIAPLTVLFLFAGKSLAAVGAERGWASPWIAVSVVFILP